jgi:hypothetical protein
LYALVVTLVVFLISHFVGNAVGERIAAYFHLSIRAANWLTSCSGL